MTKIYKITKGQLIVLWIFGILFILGDLFWIVTEYSSSGFSLFLLLFFPGALIFYTVGWRAHNNISNDGTKKQGGVWKIIFSVIGLLLLIGTLTGDNFKYITDWSTAELVGYNVWALLATFGGIYLIYFGFKK